MRELHEIVTDPLEVIPTRIKLGFVWLLISLRYEADDKALPVSSDYRKVIDALHQIGCRRQANIFQQLNQLVRIGQQIFRHGGINRASTIRLRDPISPYTENQDPAAGVGKAG